MCSINIINLRIVYYKMNDTMSLFLATGILAIGGLGLFMYKTSDEVSFADEVYEQDYDTKKTVKRKMKKEDDEEDDDDDDEYVYKDREKEKSHEVEDEDWFDLKSYFGNSITSEKDDNDDKEFEDTKTKKKNSKTKSARKKGSTKRRY